MNLRTYFKILRPTDVAAFAGVEVLLGWVLLHAAFPSHPEVIRLLMCLVVAPLVVGRGLLWPLEYVLHQGGCAWMPGVDRAFLRVHAVAFVSAAVLLTGVCAWGLPGHSVALSAGMVVTLLALPLYFERGSSRWFDSWRMGAVALNAVAAACVLDLDRETQTVVGLAIFSVSIVVAVRGFRHCFDRRRVLARGRRPYVHYQMLVMAALELRRAAGVLVRRRKGASSASQSWPQEPVDDSLWLWLKTLFCIRFGNTERAVKGFLASALIFGPVFVLVGGGLPLLNPQGSHEGLRRGFEALRTGGLAIHLGDSIRGTLEQMYLVLGFVVAQMSSTALPRLRLPVSRRRYADYACMFSLSICAVLLAAFFLSASATLLGVDALVEGSPHLAVLYPFALITLLILSALPIALALGAGIRLALANLTSRLAYYVPLVSIGIAMSVAALMATLPLQFEKQDGLAFLVAWAVFGGGIGAWAYRAVLRRDFRVADLTVIETRSGRMI